MPYLRTFGSPLLVDDSSHTLLPKGKPLALLAYCAADRRRRLSRDECAALLWSDLPAERARHSVRQVIWRLRKALGDDFHTRDDLITGVGTAFISDREEFLDAVHAGDAAHALELYAGPYLDGVVLPGGDAFDDWLQFERQRLEEALVQVVERAVDRALLEERRSSARELVDRLLERVPQHLTAQRLLVDILLATGDTSRARQEADALAALARRDGTVLPPRIAQTLARARREQPPSVDSAPEITLDFVGRDEPFSDIVAAWNAAQRGNTSIMVVTGAAGIGKSRLLQVAQRRCAGKSTRTLLVRANAGEQGVPFGFASLLVRALGALPGALGVSDVSARELVALDPAVAASLRVEPAPWVPAESPRRRALAITDLLQAVAEQQPLCLLVDDWHWMDTASRELLVMALGRCERVPLLVVIASRHGQELPALPAATLLALAPLGLDDCLEALRSTGAWPDTPEVAQFLMITATASRGVPIELYERLTVAVETGLLQLQGGEWHATAWELLLREVTGASPLMRRLGACTTDERRRLLLLTVAGMPLGVEVLYDAELAWIASTASGALAPTRDAPTRDAPTRDALDGSLLALEAKTLVRHDGRAVILAHDTVGEALQETISGDERRRAHAALATAFERTARGAANRRGSGDEMDVVRVALRHALQAGLAELAGRLMVRLVAAARARGDSRGARAILLDVAGNVRRDVDEARVLRAVPWWQRRARPSGLTLGALSALVAITAVLVAWRQTAKPVVQVVQSPLLALSAPTYGTDVYRLTPSLMVASEGDVTFIDSAMVRVQSVDDRADVIAGGETRMTAKETSLSSLRVRFRDSVAVLRVTMSGHRPAVVTVRRKGFVGVDPVQRALGAFFKAALVEGTFGTQRITADQPALRVRPGEQVEGVVQMRYTSVLTAASVWVSYTPTWGDPQSQGREVTPLLTPTLSEIVDLPVQFAAPPETGRYWIVVVVAAEPSGGFALSGTNWTLEKPIWTDGDEIARLPDAVIAEGNRVGWARVLVTFPQGMDRDGVKCDVDRLSAPGTKRCATYVGLFGIPVIVE